MGKYAKVFLFLLLLSSASSYSGEIKQVRSLGFDGVNVDREARPGSFACQVTRLHPGSLASQLGVQEGFIIFYFPYVGQLHWGCDDIDDGSKEWKDHGDSKQMHIQVLDTQGNLRNIPITTAQIQLAQKNVSKAPPPTASAVPIAQNSSAKKSIAIAATGGNSQFNKQSYVVLKPGESAKNFKFSKDGSIYFKNKIIHKYEYLDVAAELHISPPSPMRGYFYAVLWDTDKGGLGSVVVDGKECKVIARFTQDRRKPIQVIGEEIRWSPNETYAIVPERGEVQRHVNVIDLKRGNISPVDIGNLEQNKCQLQLVDNGNGNGNGSWLDDETYRFRVGFENMPVEWRESGIRCNENQHYPDYEVAVNARTKRVSSGILKSKISSTKSQSSERQADAGITTVPDASAGNSAITNDNVLRLVGLEGADIADKKGVTACRVLQVYLGTPAANAGIKAEDVIVRFDGKSLNGCDDLKRIASTTQAGKAVPVEVIDLKKRIRKTIEIVLAPSAQVSSPKTQLSEGALQGVETSDILLEKIERRLKALPPPPEYLYETNSFLGSVSSTTSEVFSVVSPSRKQMRQMYDELFLSATEYLGIAQLELIYARRLAKQGRSAQAEKHIKGSEHYLKLHNYSSQGAIDAYRGNIDAMHAVVEPIYEASKFAAKCLGKAIHNPAISRTVDTVFYFTDYWVEASDKGLGEASINLVAQRTTAWMVKTLPIGAPLPGNWKGQTLQAATEDAVKMAFNKVFTTPELRAGLENELTTGASCLLLSKEKAFLKKAEIKPALSAIASAVGATLDAAGGNEETANMKTLQYGEQLLQKAKPVSESRFRHNQTERPKVVNGPDVRALAQPPAQLIQIDKCLLYKCEGRYKARKKLAVLAAPDSASQRIGSVAAGTKFDALTAAWVTYKPSVLKVRERWTAEENAAYWFEPGDLIYVYANWGEGCHTVWTGGYLYGYFDEGHPPGGGKGGRKDLIRCLMVDPSSPLVENIQKGSSELWVKMKFNNVSEGWLSPDEGSVEYID